MKVIFMGTPDFAVPTLEKLSDAGHEVSLVITQEDKQRGRGKKVHYTPVKEKALGLGLEVYQPQNVNSEESIEKIKSLEPDIIVVVAYGQILSEEILFFPKYGCLNVHASILPKYRGPAPLNWAIINGEKKSGVTIMEMAKGLDTGDIISVSEICIDDDMTAGELHDTLMSLGAEALVDTLELVESESAKKVAQDHEKSSYAPMMKKELGHINWSDSAENIKNLIRGTQPWPGAYFFIGEKMIKVRLARVEGFSAKGEVGEIVKADSSGIYILTGKGVLAVEEIQSPGKRWMSVEEYLRGNKVEINAIVL